MKKQSLVAAAAIAAGISAAWLPAHAFDLPGGLPGIGSKSGGTANGDPAAIERDLRSIIAKTSASVAMFFDALNRKDEADKLTKNAECIEKNTCGVKDGVETLTALSDRARDVIAKKKAGGEKLNEQASARAIQAALPGLAAMPTWKKVIDDGRSLNASSALSAGGLVRALPLVPGAAKGSVDFWKTSIDYLTYSGAKTTELTETLQKGMTGI
jgi:hypothetical protein